MSKIKTGPGMKRIIMQFRVANNIQQPKKGQKNKDQLEYRKIYLPVWTNLKHYSSSKQDDPTQFEWPEYSSDSKRIKNISKATQGKSIVEAFKLAYGDKITINEDSISVNVNKIPTDLKVGDVIGMTVVNVSKNDVRLECTNCKQDILSSVNLYKYENFKRFIPKGEINCKVVSVNANRVTVDPLTPMVEEWLFPILQNPNIQRNINGAKTIKVKNLKLTRGGYIGQAVIPNVSSYVGEDYTIDAFIPGSQIVLNIEDNFEKWNGKTVEAFVSNYIQKPNPLKTPSPRNKMSLICSVKDRLKFESDQNMIKIFKMWCDDGEEWKKFSEIAFDGIVTGVINSSKKCGVFVEIPDLSVTGFINTKADDLVNYPPKTRLQVCISDIEENLAYDDATGQMKHELPYVINNDILEKCYIKPILTLVK